MNDADKLVSRFLADTLGHSCANPDARIEDGDPRGCGEGTCDWQSLDLDIYWRCCWEDQRTQYFDNWNDMFTALLEWSAQKGKSV